jgi:hypothetical protein
MLKANVSANRQIGVNMKNDDLADVTIQDKPLSLFDDLADEAAPTGKMKIVRAETLAVDLVDDAMSLFDGYKSMKAITWSYGISMVVRQMRKFEDVELVFGCKAMLEKQVRLSSLNSAIVQGETLRSLQNKWGREISDRIEQGKCRLYFENTVSSHQKIYLLSDEAAGKYRVITGSANFSDKAWRGDKQKEVIQVCDDEDSYRSMYEKFYVPFRESCATYVENLKARLDNLDKHGCVGLEDIPVLDAKGGLVVLEKADDEEAEVSISMADCALLGGLQPAQAEKLESCFADDGNRYIIDRASMATLKIEGDKIRREREQQEKECPRLTIAWDEGAAYLNGKPLKLDGYKEDAKCVVEFVDSLDLFSGDAAAYQSDAWKIITWYFATPFFSKLRRSSILAKQEGLLISLPMFMFLYGDANAGKTSLLKFLGKAMCGESIEPLEGAEFKDGTPSKSVRSNAVRRPRLMQVNQKGLPVLYDDVSKSQMTDSPLRKLLTTPYARTLDLQYDGYPAVVATSNITPPMPQEFQKRALFFQVSASLNQKQAIENGHIPNRLTDQVGSAFFAEYVRRATPLFASASETERIADLDVYRISSGVIMDILDDVGCKPTWAVPLCIDDYFGEAAMCQRASRSLKRYFIASRDSFERNVDENQLIVRCQSGDKNAAEVLRGIAMMLPPRFRPEFSPGMLTCNLREVEELCGVRFSQKESWWRRLLGI